MLRCALSGAYMTDPVIVCTPNPPTPLEQGVSYERAALQAWCDAHGSVEFVTNAALGKLIRQALPIFNDE